VLDRNDRVSFGVDDVRDDVMAVERLAGSSVRAGDLVTPSDGDVRFHLFRMSDSEVMRERGALGMPDDDGPADSPSKTVLQIDERRRSRSRSSGRRWLRRGRLTNESSAAGSRGSALARRRTRGETRC
jgi:hypothetical protein